MRNTKEWAAVGLILVFGMVLTISCAGKTAQRSGDGYSQAMAGNADEEAERLREMERQQRIEEKNLQDQKNRVMQEKQKALDRFLNEDIRFDFDEASLDAKAQQILRAKAAYLKKNPGLSVIVEGHCDEQGTTDYNLALGDRRARSAKTFLMDLGIDGSRMSTISYGEERPLDPRHNEAAWAKNRRAHFVIDR